MADDCPGKRSLNFLFLDRITVHETVTYTTSVFNLLIAKPVNNLALRVFQRYYHELCEALSSCPEQVAGVLYSNELAGEKQSSGHFGIYFIHESGSFGASR